MASRDPAFLWESEVLRAGRPRASRRPESQATVMSDPDWRTLQEASEATGVPAATIRKWARHQNVPTFLEQTEEGYLRYVSMTGIRHWAGEIGRDIETREIDLEVEEAADDSPAPPEGSMLVPLDAWNRLLNQLGNLHEAGQQLAEARERAAKAETEARFLRERMAELREELEQARTSSSSTAGAPVEQVEPNAGLTGLARKAYTGWRRRRRG